ncbi:MAG: MarR family winged helix-turn-helix transcriptional regulator [Myxococcota bacterium]|nr:MarR family winged helix-turn-helix transcriptional regulator [Myxococcota bacterium]
MAAPKKRRDLREQAQRTARQTAGECLLFRVRALSRTLTSLYEEPLRPLGLKPTQMNVMTAIAARGEARLSEVADMIALEPSSLSRIVDVLRRNEWVEMLPDPADERARLVRLTDAGAALYNEAIPLWRKAQARAREALGPDGAEAFKTLADQSLSRRAP